MPDSGGTHHVGFHFIVGKISFSLRLFTLRLIKLRLFTLPSLSIERRDDKNKGYF